MIEYVKDLPTELCAEPLPELEVLEHGEIHVLEARVPEDVPAHISEGSQCVRSQDRVARREAAGSRQIIGSGATSRRGEGAGGMGHAIRDKCRGVRRGRRREVNPGCLRARGAAGINRGRGSIWITNCESRAVRNGIRT